MCYVWLACSDFKWMTQRLSAVWLNGSKIKGSLRVFGKHLKVFVNFYVNSEQWVVMYVPCVLSSAIQKVNF